MGSKRTGAGRAGTDTGITKRWKHWEVITFYLLVYDVLAVNFAYFFGLLLRFDLTFSRIPQVYMDSFLKFAPFYTVFAIIIFWILRLYNSLWKFAGFSELNRILAAAAVTTLFQSIGITAVIMRMPMSYYIFGAATQFGLVTAVRFSYRFITLGRSRREKDRRATHNAMVIGAGEAGHVIIRELKNSGKSEARPLCVIDDDANKWGRMIEGIPIVGGRGSIMEAVKKYNIDQIMFAIPVASMEDRRDILNICKETGCELKSLPGLYQLTNGEISLNRMKAVAVEDLLGREPVKVDLEGISRHLRGKTILVTGGGGSIGSELCRQIAGQGPGHLIIFDIYENNAYEIEQELKRIYPDLKLTVLIGSVRDSRRINGVFEAYRPEIVYHAAAHKHVPLMESSPNEAIKNNVVGTYKTAYAALTNGARRFVLISTDKAVNPTNIMGASKRLCEMVVQSMDAASRAGRMALLPLLNGHGEGVNGSCARDMGSVGDMDSVADTDSVPDANSAAHANSVADANFVVHKTTEDIKPPLKIESVENRERQGTQFVAVRFGNVLASNGSVVPLFKKQIEAGGPVTVTHPEISRYFMTIPEAVSLVLQAGIYAWGGEIFVLDMGEPVRIDALARNLIKLSGYKPDEEIEVAYTGLRPGEKLFEEKLMAEEGMEKTANRLIHIGKPVPFDPEKFLEQLEALAKASYENRGDIARMVADIVPTFKPAGDGRE